MEIHNVRHEELAAVNVTNGFDCRREPLRGMRRSRQCRDRCRLADHLQGRGIGRALTTLIVHLARANRVARLTATTQCDNGPARIASKPGIRVRDTGELLELALRG
jgi:hypothetical protein